MDAEFKREYMNEVPPDAVGVKDGLCNWTTCRRPGADYFNWGSRAWYCGSCAQRINDAHYPDVLCVHGGVDWQKYRDEADKRGRR